MKVATADPAGIRTEAGTLTATATLLDKDTLAPPDGAAFEIVTEQAVVADGARLELAHCSEVTCAGATNETVALAVTPASAAVTEAVESVVNEPAVALKVELAVLAAITTVEGTVIPADVRATDVSEATAPLIETVQTATAPGASDAGAHDSPLRDAGAVPPIEPLVVLVGIGSPV